ncbi:MAG: ParB/RepB/Spo0J family partition protein [Lachnospiraceae bacterium]|nr:ParB/RepB/Spo0J family partition protein [Lachnospiraceae bacterium]
MTKKTGLGKGIDALFPASSKKTDSVRKQPAASSASTQASAKDETKSRSQAKEKESAVKNGLQVLRLSEIEPNRKQPRKNFDEDALLELSESIRLHGVIQPLVVQKKSDHYEIIAGERRWRAAKQAGLKEVPVVVKDYSDLEVMEISLIENIQREDLNPIEEAMAYRRLLDEYKLKQDEVAEKVSKSRTAVTNSVRLLKLDERVQQMLVDEMISTGHARCILGVDDKDQQYAIACRIFDEKLSVRDVEKLMKKLTQPKREKGEPEKDQSFIYQDLEEKLKQVLGTKVTIDHKKNHKGKIAIEYYSDAELERIIELFQSIRREEEQ